MNQNLVRIGAEEMVEVDACGFEGVNGCWILYSDPEPDPLCLAGEPDRLLLPLPLRLRLRLRLPLRLRLLLWLLLRLLLRLRLRDFDRDEREPMNRPNTYKNFISSLNMYNNEKNVIPFRS